MMRGVLTFPSPVNEKAARTVAFVVMLVSAVALAAGARWLLVPLAVGFLLRVAAGPRLSPLGLLATKVIAPRLGAPKLVPGPPKRFAQAMGAAMTSAGAILAVGFGLHTIPDVLLGAMVVAAGLESLAAVCLGCNLFAVGMRIGLVPEAVCRECADVRSRPAAAASQA